MGRILTMPTPISVVIVTRNRAPELKNISLPSLARQTHSPVQVLLWDASDDEATRDVAGGMQAAIPGLTYVRAPRRGTASQRNDAIARCTGDIVLFLDDDTELWPNALQQMALVFDADTEHRIAGCQPVLVASPSSRSRGNLRWLAAHVYRTIFLLGSFSRRQGFLLSGHTTGGEPLPERLVIAQAADGGCGESVQWLSGACMAWRRDVFDVPGNRFDEDLQVTSSYAFLEDVMFSRQVLRTAPRVLVLARKALCTHHEVGGGRPDLWTFGRMYALNFWLLWHKQVDRTAASVLAFLWSQVGLLIAFAARDLASGHFSRVRGLAQGWHDIRAWRP
jgi:GT2 family glycosyltransferase